MVNHVTLNLRKARCSLRIQAACKKVTWIVCGQPYSKYSEGFRVLGLSRVFRVKGLTLMTCCHPSITFWARNQRKDKRCTADVAREVKLKQLFTFFRYVYQ